MVRLGNLPAGVYAANIVIDAGPVAGSRTLRAELTGTEGLPPPIPVFPPVITSVTNAASFLPGPLVPGSLATIKGARLAGASVTVTFGELAASLVLYRSETQINLQVPPELIGRDSVQVAVTVDGSRTAPLSVPLAAVAPAIFNPGILNQDFTVNSPANPALAGSYIQIFSTGLLSPLSGAVTVKIHDADNLTPAFAGLAPGLPGVHQVNVAVPAWLPTMITEVVVCGSAAITPEQRVCSPAVSLPIMGRPE